MPHVLATRPSFAKFTVILTARGDDVDRIVGLEIGATTFTKENVNPDFSKSLTKSKPGCNL